MMPKPLTLIVAALLVLAGCSNSSGITTPVTTSSPAVGGANELLTRLSLTGKSAQEIIETLDQDTRTRPLPLRASVRPDEVILSDETSQASLPIVGDRAFYLAIAPFMIKTHECFHHSLATCQGELVSKPVQVRIVDSAGVVLVDAERTTYTNGFVSFWLPRNITGTITVAADGRTGSVPFATNSDSPTCLTTLKMT
ncbi:MAG: CueP family metal-binding protein [Micropruina sp.]|nr:CueP family metal-binding protein [Micropruina sp.]